MSSSSSSADLAKLQAAVKDLQSTKLNLPFDFDTNKENSSTNNNNSIDNNNSSSTITKALLQKYKSARQHYIQQRTTELFLEHLQQYDPSTNTFPLLPQSLSSSERAQLQSHQNELLSAVKQTMDSVNGEMEEVQLKYAQLEEKREEFVQIVEGMERSERQRTMRMVQNEEDSMDNLDNDEDDDEEITESDVAQQQDHLNELQQRKLHLENRLRAVRAQIMDVEDDCHRTKQVVNEVRMKSGRKALDWRGFGGGDEDCDDDAAADNDDNNSSSNNKKEEDDVEYICNVDNEIVELQERAAELKQSGEFYDGIRELMEELGGVKILSSSAAACDDERKEEGGFTLTLKLLGCHILEILLKKIKSGGGGGGDSLAVASAKLTTPTTFPMPEAQPEQMNEDTENLTETINQSLSNVSLSKIMAQKQTVSIAIPPLDDLVKWSRSLESSQGIRFVLVETMARIRTLDARVAELTHLRQNYAAQVYDIETSLAQFGGAEQEVVCAINEGITVALRLTADCPLVPGSVYISELFGVGGWEEEKLATLKGVVEQRRCKGPVEVMEVMVKEIRRRRNEEGWAIPLTPSLPRGGK